MTVRSDAITAARQLQLKDIEIALTELEEAQSVLEEGYEMCDFDPKAEPVSALAFHIKEAAYALRNYQMLEDVV